MVKTSERIAIIDLGTNTFNLLIVEKADNQRINKVFSNKYPVLLGEGGLQSRILRPEALLRARMALIEIIGIANNIGVSKIKAFATSAIREAKNAVQFLEICNELKLEVKVLTGDQEAEYIYAGVKLGFPLAVEPSLIMDIGGGSTEFIIANNKEILWKGSYLLGVARMIEVFNPKDSVTIDEVNRIENYLNAQLEILFEQVALFGVVDLIGSSGAFDSYWEILAIKHKHTQIALSTTFFTFNKSQILELLNSLIQSNLKERQNLDGLIPMRVNMIVMASIITRFIFTRLSLKKISMTTYSLKEGVIKECYG